MRRQCHTMWLFGVALQARIPLHQICQKDCFWMPTMGVFEMRNAKKRGFLARRSKRASLCTESARKSVCGYLVWGCLHCAMPKKWVFGVALQASIPLHQICPPKCFWIPSRGIFEMRNAINVAFCRGAPSVHNSAPNLPERVFLDT